LPLASRSPLWIAAYLSQCLWVAPLAVIRFGLLTPLIWFVPPLARLVRRRASSLVMDPAYLRPLPTDRELRIIRWQELGCFSFLVGCLAVPPLVFGRPLLVLALHAYLTSVVLILLNGVRTLAAHRYQSDGREETFIEQMLDSVTLDSDSLLAILINPIGLRYHATHHLFPSLPYHNLRKAHKRLLKELPADSPYRQTVEHSLVAVLLKLCRAAAGRHSPPRPSYASGKWESAASVG
jgi:fatty acid desaturase